MATSLKNLTNWSQIGKSQRAETIRRCMNSSNEEKLEFVRNKLDLILEQENFYLCILTTEKKEPLDAVPPNTSSGQDLDVEDDGDNHSNKIPNDVRRDHLPPIRRRNPSPTNPSTRPSTTSSTTRARIDYHHRDSNESNNICRMGAENDKNETNIATVHKREEDDHQNMPMQ